MVLITFPVDGAPCKSCDSVCRKFCKVAPLFVSPVALSRLLKLVCRLSIAEPDEDDVPVSAVSEPLVSDEPDEESCCSRFCSPLSMLLVALLLLPFR